MVCIDEHQATFSANVDIGWGQILGRPAHLCDALGQLFDAASAGALVVDDSSSSMAAASSGGL
jgi:hypothetical protein